MQKKVYNENPDCVQKDWHWINEVLRLAINKDVVDHAQAKADVFSSDYPPEHYLDELRDIGLVSPQSVGLYPIPMISPSPSFPFTLNSPEIERVLVRHFTDLIAQRTAANGRHGWICDAGHGQAFLVWGTK